MKVFGDLKRLNTVLKGTSPRVVACSGGVDSMLLATLAHRQKPEETIVVHAVGPAVPSAASTRVKRWANQEKWQLQLVNAGEFDDPEYLANPVNRCFHCKKNLYRTLRDIREQLDSSSVLLSGTNLDDLDDFRPGLGAAEQAGVRHPFVEASITKPQLREIARQSALPFADLPAAPCLASRLYTGTRVQADLLQLIDQTEEWIREQTGLAVVRCRVHQQEMLVEVENPSLVEKHHKLVQDLRARVLEASDHINSVVIDPKPYQPGRAFVRGNLVEDARSTIIQ
ncbi:MAG: ATPase [SAR324 cluster bacterium]|nr:ATPase [SAR324 cluster bacterium]